MVRNPKRLFRVTWDHAGYGGQNPKIYTNIGHIKSALKGFFSGRPGEIGNRVVKIEVAEVGPFKEVDVTDVLGPGY